MVSGEGATCRQAVGERDGWRKSESRAEIGGRARLRPPLALACSCISNLNAGAAGVQLDRQSAEAILATAGGACGEAVVDGVGSHGGSGWMRAAPEAAPEAKRAKQGTQQAPAWGRPHRPPTRAPSSNRRPLGAPHFERGPGGVVRPQAPDGPSPAARVTLRGRPAASRDPSRGREVPGGRQRQRSAPRRKRAPKCARGLAEHGRFGPVAADVQQSCPKRCQVRSGGCREDARQLLGGRPAASQLLNGGPRRPIKGWAAQRCASAPPCTHLLPAPPLSFHNAATRRRCRDQE